MKFKEVASRISGLGVPIYTADASWYASRLGGPRSASLVPRTMRC